MIAELLENRDLRTDGNHLTEDLHFLCAALDDRTASAGRLESDEEHEIAWIGHALKKVVQNASTGNHAARRDNDAGILHFIDALGFLRRLGEREAFPFQ